MWLIFLASALVVAGAALIICFVGNEMYIIIRRRNKRYEVEAKAYEKANEEIEKAFQKEKEYEK